MLMCVSCITAPDTSIMGVGEVELDDNGNFVCQVGSQKLFYVDSVLVVKDGTYTIPVVGNKVTVYTVENGEDFRFAQGDISQNFLDEYYAGGYNFFIDNAVVFFAFLILCYGFLSLSIAKDKEKRKKQEETQKVEQS